MNKDTTSGQSRTDSTPSVSVQNLNGAIDFLRSLKDSRIPHSFRPDPAYVEKLQSSLDKLVNSHAALYGAARAVEACLIRKLVAPEDREWAITKLRAALSLVEGK